MNAQREAVTHHQNRRVAQGQAVGQQLLEGGVEVFTGRLVLPGERAALEHIGITGAPANDGAFFFKQIAVFNAGFGHAEQVTQVNEVALRALLFV